MRKGGRLKDNICAGISSQEGRFLLGREMESLPNLNYIHVIL